MSSSKNIRRQKIRFGIRKKISGSVDKPRLAVFRSNTGIYAQLIDDKSGLTLASASNQTLSLKGLNAENSKKVGAEIAKKAVDNGISKCVFDRGGYIYHGNVKALAEGAREAGLKF
jgi:large subunit ribosomal protein L18